MHLLFLNPVGSVGGAERVLLQLIAGVGSLRPSWRRTLLTMTDGPLLGEAAKRGATTVCLPMPPSLAGTGDSHRGEQGRLAMLAGLAGAGLASLPYLRKFRESVRKLNPDLVHSNGIKSHLLSRFGISASVPRVWHLHDYFSLRPAVGKLLRLAMTGVRGAIAISRSVADDAAKALPGLPTRVVLNAVDTERFTPGVGDGPHLDRLAGLSDPPAGTARVGLVATYALWKGHKLFLEAASEVVRSHPNLPICFYVIGGPIYHTKAQWSRKELEAVASSLGVSIGFVPFQSDPAPVYRSLDIVVHASTQPEPFGLTIAEAMACGRSVVLSRAGGAVELFTEGIDALGFTPGNATELATTIARMAADESLRNRLGTAARVNAMVKFSPARFAHEAVEFLDAISRSKTR